MFPRVEYIRWIQGRPEQARHDLATSDLRTGEADPGQVVPDALVDLPDPDPSVTLETQVADAYGVDESTVLVTAGATHAYLLAVAAAIEGDDDRVLVELPGYEPLRRIPAALGATVDRFRRPSDEGYPLDPGRVAAAVVQDTSLVVATNRHNPSGRLADRETLARSAEAAREEGARLLVDEVYAAYTATPTEGAFGGPTAAGVDGAVVTGSLTKFHGLGGLKIGWIVADEPFLEAVREVYDYLPVRAQPSTALARRTFENEATVAGTARERVRENHALLAEFVAGREDLSATVPDGSPFGFLAHESADGDAVAAAAWDQSVLVVPGRFFEDDARFRVSLGGDPEAMATGLDALGVVLDDL